MPHCSLPLSTLESMSAFPSPATFPYSWPPLRQNRTTTPTPSPRTPTLPQDPASTPQPPQHHTPQNSPVEPLSQLHQLPAGNRCLQQHSPLFSRAISADFPWVQHLDHCKDIPSTAHPNSPRLHGTQKAGCALPGARTPTNSGVWGGKSGRLESTKQHCGSRGGLDVPGAPQKSALGRRVRARRAPAAFPPGSPIATGRAERGEKARDA